MGELLNRGFQLEILQTLADAYPAHIEIRKAFEEPENNSLYVNLAYLNEHDLVFVKWHTTRVGKVPAPNFAKITAAGLDFLQDDGGLSSILGVVTVRFDDATLRSLLTDRIAQEDGDPTVKSQMIAAVKAMPAEGIKAIGQKAISYGIAHAPTGIQSLKDFLDL